jgi:hypothetical protein
LVYLNDLNDVATLVEIRIQYEGTDQSVVQRNLKRLMKIHGMDNDHIIDLLGITQHTAYSYKKANGNKPLLFSLVLLSTKMGINVSEFFKN